MLKHYIKLHFVVFIWSFTSILGVLLSISSVEIVFYRTLISLPVLAGLLFFLKQRSRISRRHLITLLFTGGLISLHWILFFASAKVSKVSISLAGMATATLFTSILEPLMTRRRLNYYELFLGLFVLVGLYAIFRFEYNHILGLALSLISAFLAALFSIINSTYAKKYDPVSLSFYEMLGAFFVALLLLPIYKMVLTPTEPLFFPLSPVDWIWLLILAVVCTVYGFYASMQILRHLSAFTVNLIINLEPIYGIFLAILIFGRKEQMSFGFYVGVAIILLSVLSHPILSRRFKPKFKPQS